MPDSIYLIDPRDLSAILSTLILLVLTVMLMLMGRRQLPGTWRTMTLRFAFWLLATLMVYATTSYYWWNQIPDWAVEGLRLAAISARTVVLIIVAAHLILLLDERRRSSG